uniref:Uncharacterized protein n=1 Tax=Bradyrhizobium amphicarpaeae TaxID=1404768 RepID=A0A2U8PRJ4_9BRAD|nr:hypothetical protein CIT40_10540 [Bradyrhizobium amphicarpaeae]
MRALLPSLRAQRSNPESLRGKTLDCFAALAMTMWIESAYVEQIDPWRAPHRHASRVGLSPHAGRGEGKRAKSASAAPGSSSALRCRRSRARTRRWCACG